MFKNQFNAHKTPNIAADMLHKSQNENITALSKRTRRTSSIPFIFYRIDLSLSYIPATKTNFPCKFARIFSI